VSPNTTRGRMVVQNRPKECHVLFEWPLRLDKVYFIISVTNTNTVLLVMYFIYPRTPKVRLCRYFFNVAQISIKLFELRGPKGLYFM